MKKSEALSRVRKLKDRIAGVQRAGDDSEEFKKWRRDVGVTLTHVFGNEDASQVQDFKKISFHPIAISIGGDNSHAYHQAFMRGLKNSQAFLDSVEEEIAEFWPSEAAATPEVRRAEDSSPGSTTRVFVVHGRNTLLRDAMFAFLRAIHLQPLEWSQAARLTKKPSPYVGEILSAAFSHARAVVVLLTPDELASLRPEFLHPSDPPHERDPTGQARPNVLFEAGMAMGRHEDRTVMVEIGSLRPFSDLAGRHVIRLDNSSQRRQDLAHRLEAAGCSLDLSGTDWHSAGDFSEAHAHSRQPGVGPRNAPPSATSSKGAVRRKYQ